MLHMYNTRFLLHTVDAVQQIYHRLFAAACVSLSSERVRIHEMTSTDWGNLRALPAVATLLEILRSVTGHGFVVNPSLRQTCNSLPSSPAGGNGAGALSSAALLFRTLPCLDRNVRK